MTTYEQDRAKYLENPTADAYVELQTKWGNPAPRPSQQQGQQQDNGSGNVYRAAHAQARQRFQENPTQANAEEALRLGNLAKQGSPNPTELPGVRGRLDYQRAKADLEKKLAQGSDDSERLVTEFINSWSDSSMPDEDRQATEDRQVRETYSKLAEKYGALGDPNSALFQLTADAVANLHPQTPEEAEALVDKIASRLRQESLGAANRGEWMMAADLDPQYREDRS